MNLVKLLILVTLITVVSCAKHPYGQQISIHISDEKYTDFNFKALETIFLHPEVRNRKIVLLSIVGTYRKGKSFFLDYCLRYLYANVSFWQITLNLTKFIDNFFISFQYPSINRKSFAKKHNWLGEPNEPLAGFSWKSGSKAETKGILLWSDVFLHEENDEKVAIMLMDTQGLFEVKRKALVDAKIFGISSFLSSIQILNLNDVIQENELEYLKMVNDFTKIALKRQNEKSFDASSKPFQNLLLLVRDWSDEDIGFGYEGGDEYIKIVLDTNDENNQAQIVRNSITNAYDNVDAFLLPYPGSIRFNKYDGSLKMLNKEFVKHLKTIIEELLSPEKLVIKKIFNKEVTGNDLMNYATAIFLAYQSPDLPEIDLIFEIAVVNELKKLSDALYENYTLIISQCNYYEDENFMERLSNDHKKYQQIAIDKFNQTPKMGDEIMENQFKNSLVKKIDTFFLKWKPKALETHVKMINKQISQFIADKMAFEQRQQMLEYQQKLYDLSREQEVQNAVNDIKHSFSYRMGYVICKVATLGLAKCE